MIVFSYDDKVLDLRKEGYEILWQHSNQPQPNIEHTTTKIQGRPGLLSFGSQLGSRYFTMSVLLDDVNLRSFDNLVDRINSFFFDEYSNTRVVKGYIEYEGKYRYLEIESSATPEYRKSVNLLEIPFVSFDPYKYLPSMANNVKWGSRDINFTAKYQMGHRGSGAIDKLIVSNTSFKPSVGGFGVPPILDIQGSGKDVTIISNGKTIEVGSFTNASIRIDTSKYIGYLDGVEKLYRIPKDWMVSDGQDVNIIGVDMNFIFTLDFRDRFL